MAELRPARVLEELKNNGVTHVVWLPDSETNFLYVLMRDDPTLDLVPVSREGRTPSPPPPGWPPGARSRSYSSRTPA